jgi:hypothetical protein
MLTHLKYRTKQFAPSRLLQKNGIINSSKRDRVMPAHVVRHAAHTKILLVN